MLKFIKALAGNTDLLTAQAYVFTDGQINLILLISASGEDAFTKIRQTSLMLSDKLSLPASQIDEFLTENLKTLEELNILLAVVSENTVSLYKLGGHLAYLQRAGVLSSLATTAEPVILQPQDRILLISNFSLSKEENFISQLLEGSGEDLEDQLENYLQQGEMEPIAAVLIENPEPTPEDGLAPDQQMPGLKKFFWPILGLFLLVVAGITFFIYHQKPPGKLQQTNLPPKPEQNNAKLKIYQVSDWPVFLSLDLIKKDFSASKMSYSLGKLLLLDQNSKSLVVLDLGNKQPQVLAGSYQLGEAKLASLNGGQAFAFSEDKGVVMVDVEGQKVAQVVKPDETWGKIVDLYAFAGNIYLLDSVKNQIWKYVPVKSGFSDKFSYLKDTAKVDFAGSKRLQVDYSVWVLKSGPEIYRFTGGMEDHFSIGGLDKSLQELTAFHAAQPESIDKYEDSLLYLLDGQNSRLVVLKKNGQYVAQYIGDKFKTATDLVVDDQGKKIYLLENNKLYQIDLR